MVFEITGNLIDLTKEGLFNVIGHGCNCFCTMKLGIAAQMATTFRCDKFPWESGRFNGSILKLGLIDAIPFILSNDNLTKVHTTADKNINLHVVNMYTQYHWKETSRFGIPLDYSALELCLVKMNTVFKGKHIGLPRIGCGLAKGDWNRVKAMTKTIMQDCDCTIVSLPL